MLTEVIQVRILRVPLTQSERLDSALMKRNANRPEDMCEEDAQQYSIVEHECDELCQHDEKWSQKQHVKCLSSTHEEIALPCHDGQARVAPPVLPDQTT